MKPLRWAARNAMLVCIGLLLAVSAHAEGLLMARSQQMFPEAMTTLQNAITARGYTITRLQQVNENLAKMHFKSDMYRVVFFGKYDQIDRLTRKYPELIPYLPLSITIFAEGNQSIAVAMPPRALEEMFPDPALKPVFEGWQRDYQAIFDRVRETTGF